ncbi:TonB-dependent receptor [Massilia sp. R2A-15]|uniref:TonB-dependent receptor n=1 Tax=Massilia sp. R2A-15 TaxID=3064278 RepID=UPI0027368D3D|nr:TonB-dependent receptor [Massilia sp. R2A-15]WLI89993.1 TonB-dependent receptor [Massilia sp. R2A-15]
MFRKTVLVQALSLAFASATLSLAVVAPVMAQSNATGTIFGRVDAAQGTAIVIRNLDTNLQRRVTPEAGRYQATALPVGRYKVDLVQGDKVVQSNEVEVTIGQGADVSFAAASAIQTVQVSGQRRRIDVSNTNNGATFTAKELAKLPIAPSVDSIIQLAPNTTRADYRYAGASFGGSGASENAYYVNGFPVTNPLTGLGSSELPFGAIAQAQILTGGFGAEFGRSIGGVVNITTKSGTNNWEAGATASITPRNLRSKYKDFYYANTGAPTNTATDGKLRLRREDNKVQETRVGAYVGGPIIQDKLFMFIAADQSSTDTSRVGALRSTASDANSLSKWGWGEINDKVTRFTGKIDWNISDSHRLEFTGIGDDDKRDAYYSSYDYATRAHGSTINSGEHYHNDPANTLGVGANAAILKYTGNLTDDLTLTALFGRSTSKHDNTFDGYDVFDLSKSIAQVTSSPSTRPFEINNNQPLSGNIMPKDGKDVVKSGRLDLEYKIGSHTVRAGFDQNKLDSVNAGFITAGGSIWAYQKQSNPTVAAPLALAGPTPIAVATAGSGPLAAQGYWVRQQIFNSATPVRSEQSAQYIEDKWQVNKDVLVTVGLRDEQFKNINGSGVTYLDMKNQISPRLGAAWDVNGDASLKVFGTAGRYYLQVPTAIGVRGASRSLFTRQAFSYTGVDANGLPTGLKALAAPFSANNEYNQEKDPKTVSAVGLKPNFQDEMTLGFEQQLSPSLNIGAKATYRKLQSTLDDMCDQRGFDKWLAANPTVSAAKWRGFGCATFNPGVDNDFLVDFNDADPALAGKTYTKVHLTKEMLGFPEAKRTYAAVDLFAEHPLRNGWYGKLNYTWSRSVGNTEGQTRSENAQINPGATTTWDRIELMDGAYGKLPNDRTHQIKAYGFYNVAPEWTVGGNALIAAGRPLNCIGNHPTDTSYGSNYFWCNGVRVDRGSKGNLPWDTRLDMNVVYAPAMVKGLALKADVFNVFNKQTVQAIDETYNSGTNVVSPTYGRVTSYTDPRAIKFSVEYNHKF